MMKKKKAQTISLTIKMIVGMVLIGIMIYLIYDNILKKGEDAGELSGCQAQGGVCKAPGQCESPNRGFPGMNCENDEVCCIPNRIT